MRVGVIAGTRAVWDMALWTTRSLKWTLEMWRSFPRSRMSNSWKPRLKSRPSSRSRLAADTLSSARMQYLCTEAFHDTPLRALMAALYSASRSAAPSRVAPSIRLRLFSARFSWRRSYRARLRSSEFIGGHPAQRPSPPGQLRRGEAMKPRRAAGATAMQGASGSPRGVQIYGASGTGGRAFLPLRARLSDDAYSVWR